MKKKKLAIALSLILISSLGFQSCIGSFSLTNKVLSWNKQVSNKFVNEVVFFAFWVLPVYEVTAVADLLVINSIEFWSGNKPLEANNQVIDTDQGRYLLATTGNGYNLTSPNGDIVTFEFDIDSQTWSVCNNHMGKTDFLRFMDDHIQVIGADGDFVDVELSPEGVENYRQEINRVLMAGL